MSDRGVALSAYPCPGGRRPGSPRPVTPAWRSCSASTAMRVRSREWDWL